MASPGKNNSKNQAKNRAKNEFASQPRRLLRWYDHHARVLPWRIGPGCIERGRTGPGQASGRESCPDPYPDPYKVWLSEIMLQQTAVQTVIPYFHRFIDRWPRIEDLAAAPLDDVLLAWAGLGYYARARNLHRCALVVSGRHDGKFPDTETALRELPGVGAYTAAAVAAIAFGRKATVVDGNVERVVARLFAVETPLPEAKSTLKRLAAGLTPAKRPGDYAQAMMDLGATVCTVTRPKCDVCPVAVLCRARARGIPRDLPKRSPKTKRPTRRGVAFWVVEPGGAVLLQRRPENGLLGGMMGLPSTEWREGHWTKAEAGIKAEDVAPLAAEWQSLPGLVRHSFTHFHLELEVWAGCVQTKALGRDKSRDQDKHWVALDDLDRQALPTVMKKAVAHALQGTGAPADSDAISDAGSAA